jgi:hypothetical protein
MNFEQEIASLKDTLVVMAALERHHAEVQKLQAHELDSMRELMVEMRQGMALHEKRMTHVEQNLEEITDKLNGLIGFMDGFTRGGNRP